MLYFIFLCSILPCSLKMASLELSLSIATVPVKVTYLLHEWKSQQLHLPPPPSASSALPKNYLASPFCCAFMHKRGHGSRVSLTSFLLLIRNHHLFSRDHSLKWCLTRSFCYMEVFGLEVCNDFSLYLKKWAVTNERSHWNQVFFTYRLTYITDATGFPPSSFHW